MSDGAGAAFSIQEGAWLVGIVLVYLTLAVALIAQGTPFGHDEAVYSLRARHFVQDAPPAFYWHALRAPGLPFVMQVAWLTPATEPFLRVVPAMFGVPLIVSTWLIGRTLLGVPVGLIAAAGVALTPIVVGAATQVWPDVPGAAIGLVAIALYTWSISRDRVSRWVLLVPLLVFAATMLRFGAPVPIAIGLAGITLWRWRAALASWKLIAITAAMTLVAVSLVLFVPAVTGWAQFGEPVAPYTAITAHGSGDASPWYQRVADYWGFRRSLIDGLLEGLMVIGAIAGVVAATRDVRVRRGFWTAVGIAAATGLTLSVVVHAEPRYLTAMVPWIWIAVSVGLHSLVPQADRKIIIPALVVLAVVVTADSYEYSGHQNDLNSSQYQSIKEAARMIDSATRDDACSVISSYEPQVGWYSKCPTMRPEIDKVVVDSPWFPDGPRYLYLVESGKRQPEGKVLDGYLSVATGPVFTAGDPAAGRRQYVEVYEVHQ